MKADVSLAEAKAKFSECVRKAETGDVVLIRRHGKAVAAIVSAADVEQLQRLRAAGPKAGLAGAIGRWEEGDALAQSVLSVPRSGPRKTRGSSRR